MNAPIFLFHTTCKKTGTSDREIQLDGNALICLFLPTFQENKNRHIQQKNPIRWELLRNMAPNQRPRTYPHTATCGLPLHWICRFYMSDSNSFPLNYTKHFTTPCTAWNVYCTLSEQKGQYCLISLRKKKRIDRLISRKPP